MSTVIKIENIYKEYHLGVIGHGTLYRDLQSWWAVARGKPDPNSLLSMADPHEGKDSILALNDINLEVQDGEVLGIIGANGAGKSTLLKILSKVTAPTRGTIKYKGRVASLLEVGTGFHFELTGRENIYLNGAINGMNRQEVSRKLDEIVAFSGVGKFLDTPVKRYSSGMHVRLGFAVAAHLDPKILVVDEVLAVGDAEFQKKAVRKMKSVSRDQGRTVLFVSHNMDSIKKLCSRAILMKSGSVIEDGKTKEVINKYLVKESSELNPEKIWDGLSKTNQPKGVIIGDELVKPLRFRVLDKDGNLCVTFSEVDDIHIEFECEILRRATKMEISLYLSNQNNIDVLIMRDNSRDFVGTAVNPALTLFKTKIPHNLLNDGIYKIKLLITENSSIHIREANIVSFNIEDSYDPNGSRGVFSVKWPDVIVRPKFNWQYEMQRK